MGLTGVVTGATLRLVPLRTPWFETVTWRTGVLGETLRILDRSAHQHAMAWLDPCAPPDRMGRGVITCGEPALAEAGHSPARRPPSANDGSAWGPALGMMRPSLIRVASSSYWRMAAPGPTERTVRLEAFLFRSTGSQLEPVVRPRGLIQWQGVLPRERGRAPTSSPRIGDTRSSRRWSRSSASGEATRGRFRFPSTVGPSPSTFPQRRPSSGRSWAARLHHRTGGGRVPREGQQAATEHAAGDVSASEEWCGPPAPILRLMLRPRTPSPSARGRRMIDGTGSRLGARPRRGLGDRAERRLRSRSTGHDRRRARGPATARARAVARLAERRAP